MLSVEMESAISGNTADVLFRAKRSQMILYEKELRQRQISRSTYTMVITLHVFDSFRPGS